LMTSRFRDMEHETDCVPFLTLDAVAQSEATLEAVGEITELLNSGVKDAHGQVEVKLTSGQVTEVPFHFVVGSVRASRQVS